jgi:hypothetical protein
MIAYLAKKYNNDLWKNKVVASPPFYSSRLNFHQSQKSTLLLYIMLVT